MDPVHVNPNPPVLVLLGTSTYSGVSTLFSRLFSPFYALKEVKLCKHKVNFLYNCDNSYHICSPTTFCHAMAARYSSVRGGSTVQWARKV